MKLLHNGQLKTNSPLCLKRGGGGVSVTGLSFGLSTLHSPLSTLSILSLFSLLTLPPVSLSLLPLLPLPFSLSLFLSLFFFLSLSPLSLSLSLSLSLIRHPNSTMSKNNIVIFSDDPTTGAKYPGAVIQCRHKGPIISYHVLQ